MSSLLSNAAALSSIGVMILAGTIVVMAVWTTVLSVKVSKLNKLMMMEQERSADLARQLSGGMSRSRVPGGAARGAVSPSGMPVEPHASAAEPVRSKDADRAKKPKGRKGKPTIPFGENKEAQKRASQAYADMAESPDYNPDSIDFGKVEGLRSPQVGTMPADAHPVRSASPMAASAAPRQQARTREPRQRNEARALEKQKTGKMPTVSARQATAATKESFDRVGEELRSRNGTSSAWVKEDARRVVERHERAAKRQRLSERRQQEQLRRQAESIVAEHHRQMSKARTVDQ